MLKRNTKKQRPTLADVLDGPAYAAVKGTGVGGAQECQAELLVVDPPVVEDGVDLVVHDVPLQDALQHHLATGGQIHCFKVFTSRETRWEKVQLTQASGRLARAVKITIDIYSEIHIQNR